ncbi:MAG: hypothetical protein KAW47_08810 [Thermoplasmatales archaeon]|nr:hypothetical protein [Thermoplasmatales archaeon]
MKIIFNRRAISVLSILCMILSSVLLPIISAADVDHIKGFDKGPSYKSVIPLKEVTFVNFDEETLLDDYAYLASVPTAVFDDGERLFSHPLLFYQDEYPVTEDKERSLNARQGLDYFMDDWMDYCNGRLDQMTLVNVPKNKASQWDAKEYNVIESENPYDIAGELALNDWSYSNDAVVAVIEEQYDNPNIQTEGEVRGTLESCEVGKKQFKVEKPIIGTGATYHSFEILDNDYKYIVAKMSWKEKFDYDLQLYDDQLGMVQAAANSYKQLYPWSELVGSYIHNYGDWEVSVSAFAKKSTTDKEGKIESMFYKPTLEATGLSKIFNTNTIDIGISLLPGINMPFEATPYGCKNIDFTLKWGNPEVELGFTILDPIKNEIESTFSIEEVAMKHLGYSTEANENKNEVSIHLEKLGECGDGENYSVCVFSLDDIYNTVDFTLEYSWNQNYTKTEGDGLESATNGAVLASSLNAPLLYTSSSNLPKITKDALYKLGVNNIYFVNLGGHASSNVKDKLNEISKVNKNYINAIDIFDDIRDNTDENDVIFSTIDSWDYWHIADPRWDTKRKPVGEYSNAYHFGPAAFVAAHHGSPVLVVDNHPKLSQAITWSTNLWRNGGAQNRIPPSSAGFVLTARRAYDFLEENGFGKIEKGGPEKQNQEIIITVAGQYDIGIPWGRSFTGAGLNGRFWGSPVDSAYAICRNIFYPALIFMNPAMGNVKLTQGSESTTKLIGGRLQKPIGLNLAITKPMQEEEFKYPVLHIYNSYTYRFNEENWKHFNCKYIRADGIIPWDTASPHSIDDGAAHGKTGAYYPDISESEVIPFYCDKAGYNNVFSTNFEYVTKNLNEGVLIWVVNIHGHQDYGGNLEIWDPENPYVYEENPWRTYEPIAITLGNIGELIRWFGFYWHHVGETALNSDIELLEKLGQIPNVPFQLFPKHGSTENPDVAFLNPQLTFLSKLSRPIFTAQLFDIWGPWPFMIYRDRVLHPVQTIKQRLPFINYADGDGKVCHSPPTGGRLVGSQKTGIDFDDALENLHSCGVNSISCFPANTYLHLTWMRHGTAYQIMDPWSTSDWAGIWQQMLIKLFAMGYTVGEAYERGLRACGPLYSCGQWWWDNIQNICCYGDPNLRVFVPNTEYTNYEDGYEENHWTQEETQPLRYDEELNIDGHMPFGAVEYPHEKEPEIMLPLWIIATILIVSIVIVSLAIVIRKKTKKKQ